MRFDLLVKTVGLPGLIVALIMLSPKAISSTIQPFEASYRVTSTQYSLAPSATVRHRISLNEGKGVASMRSSIRLARWNERSTFSVSDDHQGPQPTLTPEDFKMQTRVFLSRDQYHVNTDDFLNSSQNGQRPFDRQASLIHLGLVLLQMDAGDTYTFPFLDERNRLRQLHMDYIGPGHSQAGHYGELFFWFEDSPEEYVHARMSLDYPGLIIEASVYGDRGEKLLHFQKTGFNQP